MTAPLPALTSVFASSGEASLALESSTAVQGLIIANTEGANDNELLKPASVDSLHFLIHPLFVSDPLDGSGEIADARQLKSLYLEKARFIPQNGLLFMFSHMREGDECREEWYMRIYDSMVTGLSEILGNRFFMRDDSEVFNELRVAGSLSSELRRRGFRLGSDMQSFAYGEVPEFCVADGTENLREGFDLQQPTILETQYSSWMTPYDGKSPDVEADLKRRGILLR
jgi:hypothetical protein